MRVMEVFNLGRAAYDPDPKHRHDRDRDRGWWGWDERHRWHHWSWDPQRRCWY